MFKPDILGKALLNGRIQIAIDDLSCYEDVNIPV